MSCLKKLLDKHPEWHKTYLGISESRKELYEAHLSWINDPDWGLTKFQKEVLTGIIAYYEEQLIIDELTIESQEETIRISDGCIHLLSEGYFSNRQTIH